MPQSMVVYMISVRGEDKLRMALYWGEGLEFFRDMDTNEFIALDKVESYT